MSYVFVTVANKEGSDGDDDDDEQDNNDMVKADGRGHVEVIT